jgi:hypothetical protein
MHNNTVECPTNARESPTVSYGGIQQTVSPVASLYQSQLDLNALTL